MSVHGGGNGDYRLREIERRLGALEDKGSPQVRLLAERLDNEIANRKAADNDLRAETTKIDTTVTWMIRGGVLAATSGIASVAVYLLTSGRP